MDPSYASAFAALAGSVIGGLTSLTASWLTQRTQVRAQQIARDVATREELYKGFIEETSTLYADALEHDQVDTSRLVRLYAFVSRMRVRSSPPVIDSADRVMQAIIETYLRPNITLRDVAAALKNKQEMDPLREFSEACREELRMLELSGPPTTRV